MSLTDQQAAELRMSARVAQGQGRLFWSTWSAGNITGGSSHSFAFVVGAAPVCLYGLALRARGTATLDMLLELFEGGTVTGGTAATAINLNALSAEANPLTGITQGVTISTAGTKVGDAFITGDQAMPVSASFVAKASTSYYATLTNQDQTNAQDTRLGLGIARLAT